MVDYLERVSVCLLHTSVNNRHPILEKVIKDRDCHTVEIPRGVDDIVRHGTKMARTVAFVPLRISWNLWMLLTHITS